MKKKILSFILAVAFILPCAILLSACAKNEKSIVVLYGKDDITKNGTTVWVNSTDNLNIEEKITVKVVMKNGDTKTLEMSDGKKSGYVVESTIPSDQLVAGETYTYTISYRDFKPVTITVTVRKLTNPFSLSNKIKTRVYDGTPTTLTADDIVAANKQGVTIKWFKKLADGSYQEMNTNPVNAGSYMVKVNIPASNSYAASSREMKFTIKKATPTIDQYATNIVGGLGDTLADVQLPSSYRWADPTIELTSVGNHIFDAIFTPADTENYEEVNVSVTVNVDKATPEHTTISNKQVVFGTLLNSITLPEETNGRWAWKDDNDILTVGAVGERSFVAVFTPNDTENYRVVNQEVKFTVTPKVFKKPEILGSYVYTGDVLTADLSNIVDGLYVSDRTWTNATSTNGTRITIRLQDKKNYVWADGTTADLELAWIIEKAEPVCDEPTISQMYNAETDNLYDIELPEGFDWVEGQTLSVGINQYKAIFTPKDTRNYKTKTFMVSIDARKMVSIPTSVDYDYDGQAKLVELEGFDAETMEYVTSTEDRTKTEAGNYTVTVKLKNPTINCWADGGVENKTISWSIIQDSLPVQQHSAYFKIGDQTYNFSLNSSGSDVGDLTKEENKYSITIDEEVEMISLGITKTFDDLSYCAMDADTYYQLLEYNGDDQGFNDLIINLRPNVGAEIQIPLQFENDIATIYVLKEGATRSTLGEMSIVEIRIRRA